MTPSFDLLFQVLNFPRSTQNPSPYSEITTNEKHEPMINLTGCRIDPVGEKAETELRNNKIQTPLKEKAFIIVCLKKKKKKRLDNTNSDCKVGASLQLNSPQHRHFGL